MAPATVSKPLPPDSLEDPVELTPLTVKTLTGKVLKVQIRLFETVGKLKSNLQALEGIPPDQMRLISAGKALDDDEKTLDDFGVQSTSTIHMLLKLRD